MNPFDFLTRGLADGFRSLGSRHPTLIGVSIGFGFLIQIIVHSIAVGTGWKSFATIDTTPWYEYAAIVLAFLLIPSLLGRSKAPDTVLEQIASLKKIMEDAKLPESRKLFFWNAFLSKFITDTTVGSSLPPPARRVHSETTSAVEKPNN